MSHLKKVSAKNDTSLHPKVEHEKIQLSHIVFHAATEGMLVTCANKKILSVNPAFTKITGYTAEEIIGQTPKILQSGRHDANFYKDMWQQISETDHWQGEIWNRRKNGGIYPEWLSLTLVRDENGVISHYIGLFSDITKRKQAEKKIYFRANHDVLTGLVNRMLFSERLEQAIKQARRTQTRTAVIFMDLDQFKRVNDTLGHDAGDFVLQETARRLQDCVRKTDTVARISGDEFLILLTDVTGRSEATGVAEKIRKALSRPFIFKAHSIFVGGSCGITVAPDDGDDVGDLLKNADMAMYQAKSAGKNTFHFFNLKMKRSAEERALLECDLNKAIKQNDLVVHFQAIVNFKTKKTFALEALVRWQHPRRGLLFPQAFIPLAEEAHLVEKIDQWVLLKAARQMKTWRDHYGIDLALSVNVSRRQFSDATFWDFLRNILREGHLPPEKLIIEITESLILDSKQEIPQQLQQLKNAGVKTAIDDFGTGYSSLSDLSEHAIDFVKIDQSFIHDLESDPQKKAVVKTILRMGQNLEMKVIAEGVETEAAYTFLNKIGCESGQGHYFHKPLSSAGYEEVLRKRQNSASHFRSISKT